MKISEGTRPINLIADIEDAANIQNCGEINEVDANENENDSKSPDPYILPKAPEHEEEKHDACASDPCENGGTCRLVNELAVCDCPLGFSGHHCQDRKPA